MSASFQEKLLDELLLMLEPLTSTGGDPARILELFDDLGWNSEKLLGPGAADLTTKVGHISAAVQDVRGWVADGGPESLPEVVEAFGTMALAVEAVRDMPAALRGVDPSALPEVSAEIVELLFLRYLYRRSPTLFRLLRVLTVIQTDTTAEVLKNQVVIREARTVSRLRPQHLVKLLRDPLGHLKQTYLTEGLQDQRGVERLANTLLRDLAFLLHELNATAVQGRGASPPQLDPEDEEVLAGTLTAIWEIPVTPEVQVDLGATIQLVPATRGGPGAFVLPSLEATFERVVADWLFRLTASGAFGGCMIKSDGVEFVEAGTSGGLGVGLTVQKGGLAGPALLVGSTTGTRLEIGQATLTADLGLRANEQEYGFLITATSAAIVIAAGDGDGFLKKVLPPEGLRTEFELALGWSNTKGLYFGGSAGLEATLSIDLSILGVIELDSIYLALRATEEGVRAIVGATVNLRLGPVTAAVERFGLEALLTFPPEGGNFGPANLALAFKPPNGAGLAVDAAVVVGGGYLFFDPEQGQYAGVMQLEFANKVSLKAVGLLTTRMPDGSEGFSLLVIITAEGFPPIQLGFGFTLNGVGGLLGVNRTAVVDALRSGIKHGTLDSILFPKDPVKNAPQLLSTLSTVFPPVQDQYLFGPMAMIGWGTPTIVTIEIALVFEFPSPMRLLILGRLKALLPDEKQAAVQLRMDALGVIDFDRGEISLDATLYESRIATFPLTGDMALRASWGAEPTFVLAIGGLHPRFTPPPAFPKLDRLAISLAAGDNPRLRLEAYLALTSNTAQFGARLDLYVKAGGFTLEGYLGFDALFHFQPFHFVADMGGMAALRHNGRLLMGVQFDMVLTGPTPWHVRGTASFEILGFSQKIAFERQFGDEPAEIPAPEPVKVLPLLRAALEDARNWASELPPGEHPLVSLREVKANGTRFVHPLATLAVRQRVVPLDQPISRFGNVPPADGRLFSVELRDPSGKALAGVTWLEDAFAPAQFSEMSDEEKLTSPSFRSMRSGFRLAASALKFHYDPSLDLNIDYETVSIVGEPDAPAVAVPKAQRIPQAVLDAAAEFGAAGRAAVWRTGTERYRVDELVEV